MPDRRISWTEAKEKRLTELWTDSSISIRDIGNALGGMSRDSVSHKAKRLGLGVRECRIKRKPPSERPNGKQRELRVRPEALPAIGEPIPAQVYFIYQNRPEPLPANSGCQWPLGDPRSAKFRFCGAEPRDGKPYCSKHYSIAYIEGSNQRSRIPDRQNATA